MLPVSSGLPWLVAWATPSPQPPTPPAELPVAVGTPHPCTKGTGQATVGTPHDGCQVAASPGPVPPLPRPVI